MDTSALDATNVEQVFTHVLTQIYRVMSCKTLDGTEYPMSLPKGQTIDIGIKMMLRLEYIWNILKDFLFTDFQ